MGLILKNRFIQKSAISVKLVLGQIQANNLCLLRSLSADRQA